MKTGKRFSPEIREQSVRMVFDVNDDLVRLEKLIYCRIFGASGRDCYHPPPPGLSLCHACLEFLCIYGFRLA